jgi:NAD(P)H-quinone oxidoreductase subunit 5
VGCILYLSKLVPKPIRLGIPFVQDFFAYDLYTAQTYQMTIIGAVSLFSRLISWFDRHVVDGVVNSVGLTTILSGQALKYNNSGFGQFYVLSIVIGLTALVAFVAYPLMF